MAVNWLIRKRWFSSVSASLNNIGFIGIGNMGGRMAMNLLCNLREGQRLYICDMNQKTEPFKQLVARGAIPASAPESLSNDCDVFITMVPGPSHVRDLYFRSIIPSLKRPSILIDCSTIDPGTSRDVHDAASQNGHIAIDAPVSGGIKGAEAGTLTFMVGTSLDKSIFEKDIKPIFLPMGKPVYCGDAGVGQAVKICNNLILGAQMLGVSEGYLLADKLGVDLKTFNEIVNSSTGQCWTSSKYNPVPGLMEGVPASREYKGGFMTDLMIKDLGLAINAAKEQGIALPVTAFSQGQYKNSSQGGFGGLDFGSIFKWYKN